MAVEAERLVAVLEARISQFEKSMDKALGKTNSTFTAIEGRGDSMANKLNAATARGTVGFDRMGKSVNKASISTANLAAQFNDIAVTLAMGQSPLTVALQQGTQITQAFGNAGVKGALMGVGGALVSMINPLSLATIAFIALGGTAINYFTDLMTSGAESEETLKKQRDLIGQVAQKWGDALPTLREYAAELAKIEDAAAREQGTNDALARFWADAKVQIDNAGMSLKDLNRELYRKGRNTEIETIIYAFENLRNKAEAGTATVDDLKSVQDQLARANIADHAPAIAGLVAVFDSLSAGIAKASANTIGLKGQLDTLRASEAFQSGLKNSTLPTLDPLGFIDPNRDQTNRANATISETQQAALKAANAAGAASKSDPYGDQVKSIQERTSALKAETAAQAAVNPLVNDYGYALEKAKIEHDLLTSAQKAGVQVTDDVKAQISGLADGYAKASVAAKMLAEEQQNIRETMDFAKDAANGFLSDLRSGLEDGKLTWQDFGNAALNVLNKIIDKIQGQLVDALFDLGSSSGGTGLGGILGALFGSVGSSGAGGVPAFASGTNYAPGGLALVGEKGPELVNLPRGSQVIPNGKINGALARGGGSTSLSSTMNITVSGTGDKELIANLSAAGAAAMKSELDRFSKSALPRRVRQIASDPRKVG